MVQRGYVVFWRTYLIDGISILLEHSLSHFGCLHVPIREYNDEFTDNGRGLNGV